MSNQDYSYARVGRHADGCRSISEKKYQLCTKPRLPPAEANMSMAGSPSCQDLVRQVSLETTGLGLALVIHVCEGRSRDERAVSALTSPILVRMENDADRLEM
jgi:hypothetical protein